MERREGKIVAASSKRSGAQQKKSLKSFDSQVDVNRVLCYQTIRLLTHSNTHTHTLTHLFTKSFVRRIHFIRWKIYARVCSFHPQNKHKSKKLILGDTLGDVLVFMCVVKLCDGLNMNSEHKPHEIHSNTWSSNFKYLSKYLQILYSKMSNRDREKPTKYFA